MLNRKRPMYVRREKHALSPAGAGYDLMKASRSGSIVSAWMIGIPWGKPG